MYKGWYEKMENINLKCDAMCIIEFEKHKLPTVSINMPHINADANSQIVLPFWDINLHTNPHRHKDAHTPQVSLKANMAKSESYCPK